MKRDSNKRRFHIQNLASICRLTWIQGERQVLIFFSNKNWIFSNRYKSTYEYLSKGKKIFLKRTFLCLKSKIYSIFQRKRSTLFLVHLYTVYRELTILLTFLKRYLYLSKSKVRLRDIFFQTFETFHTEKRMSNVKSMIFNFEYITQKPFKNCSKSLKLLCLKYVCRNFQKFSKFVW